MRHLIFCLALLPGLVQAQTGPVLTKQYDDGGVYEGTSEEAYNTAPERTGFLTGMNILATGWTGK